MILTKSYIQNLLKTNKTAVIKALLAIYSRQTESEKATQTTKENNNIGFSGVDSVILSSFAEWYNTKGFLSPKQLVIAEKKLLKYHRQLLEIAESKGYEVSYS